MATRTQHEGKTERAKESHDRCSQPPGMRMPKTADLGTQALLVVNSFKLHLNAFKCTSRRFENRPCEHFLSSIFSDYRIQS